MAAVTLDFKLLRWQHEVNACDKRFIVVVAGRRCGKTRKAAMRLLMKGLSCPSSAAVMYVAPTNGMARVLMWDLIHQIGRPVIKSSNVNNMEIKLVNGVTVYVRGADNPDSLRGMALYDVVLDEMKDFKDNVWDMIIRPALSDHKGTALFIGTPEAGESRFRELYEKGLEGHEEWASFHFTTYDNELIDREEIEAAKSSMSTFAFNQEYMASFDTMGQNVFKEEWLLYSDEEPRNGSYYIAVDLAGFEGVADPTKKKHLDNTAISVVKISDEGKWFVKKIDFGRWDVREAAVRILMAIRTYKPICVGIEKGALMRAVMPYLTDLMRKNNVYAHIEPIPTSGRSKIDRITYGLQGLFEHGRIILNSREKWDQLKKELFNFPSRKAHDDLIDSLSMIAHLVTVIYNTPDDNSESFEVFDEVCGF